jgi:hypothetical protein
MHSLSGERRLVVCVLVASALLLVALLAAPSVRAGNITITPGSFTTTVSTSQAGAHPDMTTTFELDHDSSFSPLGGTPRDIAVELPKGLLGAANATPTCTVHHLVDFEEPCPLDTAVGEVTATLFYGGFGKFTLRELVFNLTPNTDEPAALGFNALFPVRLDTKVRSDGDYGLTVTTVNLTEGASLIGLNMKLWGVPADHNGPGESFDPASGRTYGGRSSDVRRAFLTNPTECGTPLRSSLAVDSWQNPGVFSPSSYELSPITGCEHLAFAPAVDIRPDNLTAGAPAGLSVDISVPQNTDPDGLATANVKDVSTKFPAGMVLSPSAADGLGACSDAQIGLHVTGAATCPNSSKIGTVEITTPLLDSPLTGEVFLGTQNSQDPQSGQMYRLFIQAAGSGVRIKLPGSVTADPVTGQLTATFASNPQLPFSDLHLQFTGGPRTQLSLPKACGTYTSTADLTSWSAPGSPVDTTSSFTLDQGCDQAGKFEPSLNAGVTNPGAGSSSPFTATLTRPDGQQDVSSLSLTLPPGLVGKLAGVPLCPETQAAAGTCSPESQIGHVAVAAGAGPNPLWLPQPGKTPTAVYLAGPYKGAPFSLSVVVPAQAGPFDLGTVVVRAPLFIDPHDAHVTVTSDPLPTILGGVPLNVQKINVTVDRPGFMVAPTNCNAMQVSGTAGSSAGASAALASRFQVGFCGALKFSPRFSVSTAGKTSKANGASLTTKLSYPAGSLGAQANVAKVKVDLPKQLPSRLATLNKACTSAQFDANPAGCPPASIVGHAVVHTPLLPVPLTGPAYFVSHGGEAFPSVVVVLQGYGVTVQLVGTTLIRKGITTTTFKSTPDVPFSSFELTFPEGPFSAVGPNLPASAKGSMCGQKLVMPTEMVAQNGAVIKQNTPVVATGCPKAKPKHKARAAHKKH